MTRNAIVGIATGVAAVVVLGIIAKRTGVLDSLMQRISDLAGSVEDKFADLNLEKFGMEDMIPKGEDKNVSTSMANHN
jgi:hypothetical protein